MALAGALMGAACTPRTYNSVTLQCSTCICHSPVPRAAGPFLKLSSVGWKRNGCRPFAEDGTKLPISRTRSNYPLRLTQGFRFGLNVRAQAEVGRADGQAEFEIEPGMDENGRKGGRTGGQDRKKVSALEDSTIYPMMRVYRDDLCTLELTGDAQAWQAIEAMGADGGLTAAEELSKGRSLMTVETIIPGRSQDHSTVSTKLLAPTHLVNGAAKTMWIHRKINMSSGNALARAFETVVMQHLLNFDIHIRSPGTARDMANLANETEDAVVASLQSRDPKVLEGLAQVLSSYSMAHIRDSFNHRISGKSKHDERFLFWRKPDWIWGSKRAFGVRSLSESEIKEQAKRMLNGKIAVGETKRAHQAWWPTPPFSLPSNFLPQKGPDDWTTEFVPIHKIQIDTSKVKVIAKGWQTTKADQVLELYLTHAQMVDLADMLDLYYEDKYTTPPKTLRSGVDLKVSHLAQSKVAKTVWTVVLSSIAAGVLLVGLLVVAKLKASSSTDLHSSRSFMASSSSRSDPSFKNKWCRVRTDRQPLLPKNEDISAEEMESLCLHVVNRVKDAFDLAGEVESSPARGAWIGSDLSQWGREQKSPEESFDDTDKNGPLEVAERVEDQFYNRKESIENNVTKTSAATSLLLYQVVLTRNGKLLGFQPGNKAAVGLWADFPFARELHNGRRLGAGLFERGLKFSALSEEVVAIELLCEEAIPPVFTARPLQL